MNKLVSLLAIAFAATIGTAYAAEEAPAAPRKVSSQQEKMKSCSKEAKAKALKGAERKSFMSTCLKGDKQ
ncbi:MAG: psiF repeat family protein [Rhodocyclaceae bacterium]|nr:psiF repeat family protein [Rhodocyclaceae bacterium]